MPQGEEPIVLFVAKVIALALHVATAVKFGWLYETTKWGTDLYIKNHFKENFSKISDFFVSLQSHLDKTNWIHEKRK